MDVREWLQNTVDREPPDGDDCHGFPDFLQPDRYAEHHRGRQSQRRRRRGSSHSPPAVLRRAPKRKGKATSSQPATADQWHPVASATTSGHGTSDSASIADDRRERVRDPSPARIFERRARRKTRPDRYEPNPKKRKKDGHTGDQRKRKPKHRKTRQHNGDGARTNGLVQSFQLKNRPKNQRLTLRPDVNAGFFKHGRSSAPMPTNGSGLPDLVFNEMKFLQRPKEHQDRQIVDDSSGQNNKKSRKQLQEEEISTYFAPKPLAPEPAKQRQQQQDLPATQPDLHLAVKDTEIQPRTRSATDRLPPEAPTQPQDRAPLANGRERPSKAATEEPATHSYLTWSESIPAKPSSRAQEAPRAVKAPSTGTTTQRKQHDLPTLSKSRARQPSRVALNRDSPRNTSPRADTGVWEQTRRTRGPTLVEMYQSGASRASAQLPRERFERTSSSRSLPRRPPTGDGHHVSEQMHRRESERYRTSDILKVHGLYANSHAESMPRSVRGDQPRGIVASGCEDNCTSTPASSILRHAFTAVDVPEVEAPSPDAPDDGRQEQMENVKPKQEDRRTQHLRWGKNVGTPVHDMRPDTHASEERQRLRLPTRGYSRSGQLARMFSRSPLQDIPAASWNSRPLAQDALWGGSIKTSARDVRLNAHLENGTRTTNTAFLGADNWQVEAPNFVAASAQAGSCELDSLQFEPTTHSRHQFQDQYGSPVESERAAIDVGFLPRHQGQLPTGMSTDQCSVLERSYNDRARSERHVLQRREEVDDMTGFWRPNKLY